MVKNEDLHAHIKTFGSLFQNQSINTS